MSEIPEALFEPDPEPWHPPEDDADELPAQPAVVEHHERSEPRHRDDVDVALHEEEPGELLGRLLQGVDAVAAEQPAGTRLVGDVDVGDHGPPSCPAS
jgi:hypothetical protein